MKNQHFQIFTFSSKMFQGLVPLCFRSTFSCQNRWLFCRRDLSLSEPFLDWFLMVWAPIWLPKPSRRPSRRHSEKTSNFDTDFYWFLAVLETSWGTQKRWKTTWTQLCGGPILAPKADWWENRVPRLILEHFCFKNKHFGRRFWIFSCFLGF